MLLGLYRDTGKANENYYTILGLYTASREQRRFGCKNKIAADKTLWKGALADAHRWMWSKLADERIKPMMWATSVGMPRTSPILAKRLENLLVPIGRPECG